MAKIYITSSNKDTNHRFNFNVKCSKWRSKILKETIESLIEKIENSLIVPDQTTK